MLVAAAIYKVLATTVVLSSGQSIPLKMWGVLELDIYHAVACLETETAKELSTDFFFFILAISSMLN